MTDEKTIKEMVMDDIFYIEEETINPVLRAVLKWCEANITLQYEHFNPTPVQCIRLDGLKAKLEGR